MESDEIGIVFQPLLLAESIANRRLNQIESVVVVAHLHIEAGHVVESGVLVRIKGQCSCRPFQCTFGVAELLEGECSEVESARVFGMHHNVTFGTFKEGSCNGRCLVSPPQCAKAQPYKTKRLIVGRIEFAGFAKEGYGLLHLPFSESTTSVKIRRIEQPGIQTQRLFEFLFGFMIVFAQRFSQSAGDVRFR